MAKFLILIVAAVWALFFGLNGTAAAIQTDVIPTSGGDLKITLVGHASLVFEYGGKVVHVDPWTEMGDYSRLPKADLVLITHQHRDHLDAAALATVVKDGTVVVMTDKCAEQLENEPWTPVIMANGDEQTLVGFKIEAVPAYNLVHKRENGQPFHPKGEGNGYIITFGDKRVCVAGDTENTPEMKALQNIDVAFLPMNLPYTMDSAMAADAAKAFKPRILYPYHTRSREGDQVAGFLDLMKGFEGVEVRVLK